MKFEELKKNQRVADSWYPDWGIGTITSVMKTRVVVSYGLRTEVYDKAHVRFLIKGGY